MKKHAFLALAVLAIAVMLQAQDVLAGSPWVDGP